MIIRYFGNEPEQITTLEQARDVEETIREAIIQMRTHKVLKYC